LSKHGRQNRCQEDLNSSPLGELDETTKTSSYYVDEDYPARPEIQNLSMKEAIVVAPKRPLWRLMSTFGSMHSPSGACHTRSLEPNMEMAYLAVA